MKRASLKRIGKIGRANMQANKKLRDTYEFTDIKHCEIKLKDCINFPLNFCHRHNRSWYRGKVGLLSSYNQTIIGCQSCHAKMDADIRSRERIFKKLRGEEHV